MLIIRPTRIEDLDQIYALSNLTGIGLTTLPNNREVLMRRIKTSAASFAADPDRPGGEQYLFVLEDSDKKKIAGTCGIVSRVGGFDPFYTYEIKTETRFSKTLNVRKKIEYLKLLVDHSGPSEIATLFLSPEYRQQGNGRFLSLSRFLFIAQFRRCFKETVIAELRGVIDEKGCSPFWEALGRHFFDVEFKKADLMVMLDKSFIADLMPTHPIYITLLAKEAQAVIGQVHKDSQAAKHLLEEEGFAFNNQIDIFEAGPLMEAHAANIRTVKESKEAGVSQIIGKSVDSPLYLIANVTSFKKFCVTRGCLNLNKDGSVGLTKETARAIGIKEGGKVRYVLVH